MLELASVQMAGEHTGVTPNSVSEGLEEYSRGSDVLTKILGINQSLVKSEGPWVYRKIVDLQIEQLVCKSSEVTEDTVHLEIKKIKDALD